MDESTFQKKLAELVQEIDALPASERAKLETLAAETKQRHQKLKETVSGLQDSIDYLRLSIKYLLFDLEATRRENNYLRKMLEEDSGS
ncbi:MAG: transcriptional regulator [Phycisphaerae bacterium]